MWNLIRGIFNRNAKPGEDRPHDDEPTTRSWSNAIADMTRMSNTAVATLTINELTQENGAEQLAELLDDLGQCGASHFVLDIQNVQYMDTACLGCLVEALNTMAKSGGKIALANADHSVKYVFKLTRLDRVFPICGDVMSAIDAVEGRTRMAG